MDPLWKTLLAVEAVLILAGFCLRFLARNRGPDAADPSHEDGACVKEKHGEIGPSATTELAARGHDTEQSSFPGSDFAELGHEFEVFLSFRGKEIRQKFADCLYHALDNVGVRTFRDNEELHVGKKIGPELMRAIKQSKISIPIFTKGYASSKWCLREVAEMVKWKKLDTSSKRVIMPIFLDVTPDVVQHQTESYAEAFAHHEKKFDPVTVKEWRDALKEVVKLKGLELTKATNGNEGEFTKLVVAEVLRELRQARLDESENLVGLDNPTEEVKQMLEVGLDDIRMVGICGMGGIGKTTLAKRLYNLLVQDFKWRSFISDVRETYGKPGGLLELQSKLASDILGQQIKNNLTSTDDATNVLKSRLRGKKALIVLDDVDHTDQLGALAANPNWFGSGSRILVTSREKAVLHQFSWFKVYELKQLHEDLALELFCKYAFRDGSRSTEFVDLSEKIVSVTGGLPLALVVTGSFLYANRGRKGVWEDTMEQLKRVPHKDVREKLRISYDALEDVQKEIFLDIACFFIGWDYKDVIPVWDDCKFYPRLGIEVLQLKSLIKIDYSSKLQMHDQLRDLGRYIVEQESSKEPELRSRLWRSEEAVDVISKQQGTSKIEGVQISEGSVLFDKCFQNLSKLRILILGGDVKLTGDYQDLLPRLQMLSWRYGRMDQLNLPLNNLVSLNLSYSMVDEDWICRNSIKMMGLKVLSLSGCDRLRRTPDFSTFPNLERLDFSGCQNLDLIDPSVGLLKNLNFLALRFCSSLRKLPDQLGNLEELAVLIVDYTEVEEIPISSRMKKLDFLSANNCHRLNSIPESVGSLTNLRQLSLEGCSSLRQLPETVGQLTSLTELRLRGSGLTCLPKTIVNLLRLQQLDISECKAIEKLPRLSTLSKLQYLYMNGCEKLNRVDEIVELGSLEQLDISECKAIEKLPRLSTLSKLQSLKMRGCEKLQLDISECKAIEKLPRLSTLSKLQYLNMRGCEKLNRVDEIIELGSLEQLDIC